jgi:ketosteroid isomerase-like protein
MKYLYFSITLLIISCSDQYNLKEQSKVEILEAEKAFAQMAKEVSIAEAFIAFADKSATIERNNMLITGIDSIRAHFSSPTPEGVKLHWTPDFVDASASGDLGYTYGKYIYTTLDSTGNPEKISGVFHTVWKKQPDGSWKYVWD